MTPDGVIQCSTGPVKVSGFNVTCDALIAGGKTLGSHPLVYSVPDINACAAKCSPIKECTGFTFHAADQAAQKRCEIFGGSPEKRTVNGYISGQR